MMKIDKSNFEAFFLDYYEGNLSPHQEECLMAFLDSEPGLKAVFEEFEMIKCSDSGTVSCSFKDNLKRGEITEHNFEWYFTSYLEGDLGSEERIKVEAFASASPRMRQELDHMLKARLQPDVALVFPNKEFLKKPVILPLYQNLLRYSGAAAAVLVLFFVGFLLIRQSGQSEYLSSQTPQPETNEAVPSNLAVENLPDPLTGNEIPGSQLPKDLTPSKHYSGTQAENEVEEFYLAYNPMPLTAIRLASISGAITHSNPIEDFYKEPRNEFALLNVGTNQNGLVTAIQGVEQAMPGDERNTFRRTLAEDISLIEDRLSANRPHSILALAGASLLELNRLVGSPIQLQTQVDENGKTVQLFVGNIEFSRRTK